MSNDSEKLNDLWSSILQLLPSPPPSSTFVSPKSSFSFTHLPTSTPDHTSGISQNNINSLNSSTSSAPTSRKVRRPAATLRERGTSSKDLLTTVFTNLHSTNYHPSPPSPKSSQPQSSSNPSINREQGVRSATESTQPNPVIQIPSASLPDSYFENIMKILKGECSSSEIEDLAQRLTNYSSSQVSSSLAKATHELFEGPSSPRKKRGVKGILGKSSNEYISFDSSKYILTFGEENVPHKVHSELTEEFILTNKSNKSVRFEFVVPRNSAAYAISFNPLSSVIKKKTSITVQVSLVLLTSLRLSLIVPLQFEGEKYQVVYYLSCTSEKSIFGCDPLEINRLFDHGLQIPWHLVLLRQRITSNNGIKTVGLFRETGDQNEIKNIKHNLNQWNKENQSSNKSSSSSSSPSSSSSSPPPSALSSQAQSGAILLSSTLKSSVPKSKFSSNYSSTLDEYSVLSVATVLKHWYRSLPTPILNEIDIEMLASHHNPKEFIDKLSDQNKSLYLWLLHCLADVSYYSNENTMNSRNLAVAFVPSLYSNNSSNLSTAQKVTDFIEQSINYISKTR